MKDKKVKILIISFASLIVLGSIFVIVKYFNSSSYNDLDEDLEKASESQSEKPEEYERNGRLYFKKSEEIDSLNESVVVELYVDTAGAEIDGFDAKISYDSEKLEVTDLKIDEANGFEVFPMKTITDGKILISGLSAVNKPLQGDVRVAEFKVMPKVKGESRLDFIFEVGSTTDCNIVEHGTVHDILGEAEDLVIVVE